MMSKPPACSLGSGERAIGYQHLAVAGADGGGIAAWLEPRAAAPDPPGVHFRTQAWDLRQGVQLGGAQDHRFVVADHQHVLHGPVPIVTIVEPGGGDARNFRAADPAVSIWEASARRGGDTAKNGRKEGRSQ
jgi:hypothetical protein